MKRAITLISVVAAVAGLAACERESSTVVTTPPTQTAEAPSTTVQTVPVPVPVPGPAGPQGPQGTPGEPGATGAPGKPGDTQVVVVPPAASAPTTN